MAENREKWSELKEKSSKITTNGKMWKINDQK